MDYTHLIGKEVLMGCTLWGKSVVGKVAQIDPDIGITIVKKDDPGFRLLCLIHPDIYRAKHGTGPTIYTPFEELFTSLVDQIENGFIEHNKTGKDLKLVDGNIDGSHCAFT